MAPRGSSTIERIARFRRDKEAKKKKRRKKKNKKKKRKLLSRVFD